MNAVALEPGIKIEIVEIGHQMNLAGLPKVFIADAVSTAFEFEGVYDLLKLWAAEDDAKEKEEIVSDIQELIDDCAQKEKVEDVYVRFDDLDKIVKNIRVFKDHLRATVDKAGGLKHLSGATGIPQPSLSRFFNSAARPRRTTLHKIAKALKLDQVQIATAWSK
jgi:DNA-binding phage protein